MYDQSPVSTLRTPGPRWFTAMKTKVNKKTIATREASPTLRIYPRLGIRESTVIAREDADVRIENLIRSILLLRLPS